MYLSDLQGFFIHKKIHFKKTEKKVAFLFFLLYLSRINEEPNHIYQVDD